MAEFVLIKNDNFTRFMIETNLQLTGLWILDTVKCIKLYLVKETSGQIFVVSVMKEVSKGYLLSKCNNPFSV